MHGKSLGMRCAALAVGAIFCLGVGAVRADNDEPGGLRGEMLKDLTQLERKVVGLAEAFSQEQYGWRPAEGIRSVSESLMHLAAANHQILGAFDMEMPEGVGEMEEITDKGQVVAAVKGAIEAVRQAIHATADDQMDQKIPFFGGEWSRRAVLYLCASHMHEHLGQSIAYARSVGVVPPWSRPASDDGDDGDGDEGGDG